MEIREVYSRWHQRVLGVARSYLPEDEAHDVTQDVFLELWRRLEEYEPPRASAWTWIQLIARSRCLDRLRSNASYRRTMLSYTNLVANPALPGGEIACDGDRVRRLLDELPREQREAMRLAYFHGLSHREIALRTSEPLGTVKTRLRLGLTRLATALGSPMAVPNAS